MLIRLIIVLVALTTVTAAQQPNNVLTLQECIRLAEGVPNSVSVAEQERRIADRDVIQARASFMPQSQLQTGFTYNSPLSHDRSSQSFIPLNGIREYAMLGTVTQEFDTSGRLRAELRRAHAHQDVARAEIEIARRDLRRAVTTAYYRLLLTRHLANVLHNALEESRNFEQRAKLLFDAGEAARADLIKASAQAASIEQSLKAAELEAAIANQELAAFWAKDVVDELAIADSLEELPPAPEAAATTRGAAPYLRRFEFNLLDAQQKGFEAEAKIARSALLPQFSFVYQYGIDSTAVRISDRGYAAYFNLRIPVFDWFRARSQREQFNLRTDQVENNRVISARGFSRDYQNAIARVKQIFDQIGLTREQVKLAEEDLRLSRVRYEGGEGQALDVVTAQTQLAQARSNYYTAVANYLNARADLEVASGR